MKITISYNQKTQEITPHLKGQISTANLIDVLNTVIYNALEQAHTQFCKGENYAPDSDEAQEYREYLFDTYNESASNLLDQFIPEQMHKKRDFSAEAIKKLEEELLQNEVSKM